MSRAWWLALGAVEVVALVSALNWLSPPARPAPAEPAVVPVAAMAYCYHDAESADDPVERAAKFNRCDRLFARWAR